MSVEGATGSTVIAGNASDLHRVHLGKWKQLGELFVEGKQFKNVTASTTRVNQVFEQDLDAMSELPTLLGLCPQFKTVLSNAVVVRLGFRVGTVDKETVGWEEADVVKVGHSLSTFVRGTTQPAAGVDAWRRHYVQLEILFVEIEHFEEFMVVIATYILKNNKAGMVARVSLGAVLSMSDGATDIFVIMNYFKNTELHGQANALIIMVSLSMFAQLAFVMATYARKSLGVKLRELLITLLLLRPAVDAYRISTNHEDGETPIDPLAEMIMNKACELAMESIPSCVLQLYVWLTNPEQAGSYALVSIGISALTTGFTSAMIAYDKDVDVVGQRSQPLFYGYIPDDNGQRGRCFVLMTMISALHNVSRSLGVALLAASSNKKIVVYFVSGEIALYYMVKCVRGEYFVLY